MRGCGSYGRHGGRIHGSCRLQQPASRAHVGEAMSKTIRWWWTRDNTNVAVYVLWAGREAPPQSSLKQYIAESDCRPILEEARHHVIVTSMLRSGHLPKLEPGQIIEVEPVKIVPLKAKGKK